MTETSIDPEAEWHAWRHGHDLNRPAITASVVASAATNRYGGMYGQVAQRLGLISNDIDPALAERGHRWEPPATTMLEAATNLHAVGEQTWAQHPENPHHRATVEGFLAPITPATLEEVVATYEIKTRGASYGPPPTDYYHAQCQWTMYVTGVPHCILAVATIDDVDDTLVGYRLTRLDADYAHQLQLVDTADQFCSYVAAGQLPPPQPAELDIVKHVHREADKNLEAIDLDDWTEWVTQYDEAKTTETDAKKAKEEAQSMLWQILGKATRGRTSDGLEIRISEPRKVVDDEAAANLIQAHPDLQKIVLDKDKAKKLYKDEYEAARKPIGARVLSLHKPKKAA